MAQSANSLSERFFFAIKSSEDWEIKFQARYVLSYHRDRLKKMIVDFSQNLGASSTRLLLALASAFGFDGWTVDVTQAYFHSSEPLMRDIFIKKRAPEFELTLDQYLQLMTPLYGLCESGDLWNATREKIL